MSFMVFYSVFIFPATYVIDKCGLRWVAIIGSGMTCLGAWIKIFSVQPDRFYVILIGQSIVAITQVIFLSFFFCIFIWIYIYIYTRVLSASCYARP